MGHIWLWDPEQTSERGTWGYVALTLASSALWGSEQRRLRGQSLVQGAASQARASRSGIPSLVSKGLPWWLRL